MKAHSDHEFLFHPACLLFPELSDQDLKALAEDIKQNGQISPIITFKGQILDGRNRLLACQMAGLRPRFKEWSGKGSEVEWTISVNLRRRHLSASQKAALALDLLPVLEEEAKKRQSLSQGRGKKGPKATSTGKSSQKAAKLTGTNSAYVEAVKRIRRKAPELLEEVRTGRLNVSEATRLSKLETSHREKFFEERADNPDLKFTAVVKKVLNKNHYIAPRQETQSDGSRIQIWCGDCVELMRERIADRSTDVITTSPPFNRGLCYGEYNDQREEDDYYSWISEVFGELSRVLKPEGSFFLIVGHSPKRPWDAFNLAVTASKHFKLQNQIMWAKSVTVDGTSHGHFTPISGTRYLNRSWDFVFHFSQFGMAHLDRLAAGVPFTDPNNAFRSGSGHTTRCGGDVWYVPFETVHSGEERGDHPATFPPAMIERCYRLAGVSHESVVLDPFCGVNGMDAAANMSLRGIGIDSNLAYCQIVEKKLTVR